WRTAEPTITNNLLPTPTASLPLSKPILSPLTSPNYTDSEYVECDACTGRKSRASKSCLTCMISYCHAHLQPHFEIVAWKDHKLTDPDVNLKEKICAKHHQSLNMFCKTDDMCICMVCVVNEHNGHTMVELEPETEEKQVKGGLVEHSSKTHGTCTSKSKPSAPGSNLHLSFIKAGDSVLAFTSFLSLCAALVVSFLPTACSHMDILLIGTLAILLEQTLTYLSEFPLHTHRFFCLLADFCPLTLDINTTNKHLHLSEGNKKVTRKETEIKYPDHPDRFEWCPQVLCREALTGTRCYWEVECSGCCMRIGVTYEGLGRNECYWQCGLGENEESWCLICSNNSYHSVQHNDVQTEVDTPYSPRLGVYLDWPAGSLSFYSVSHTMTLLHRLNTSFTKPLYPGFWLGMDASITICPLMMHYILDRKALYDR
uniref:B30.2/SPRY domain-containing protein n=1 Tax=Erpetoichthys calabaricus TaxID=27687 RepID=A0A8C4T0L7_ERPCA